MQLGLGIVRMELIQMYSEGKLKPHIDKLYSLEQAPQALEDIANRKARGKLIIEP